MEDPTFQVQGRRLLADIPRLHEILEGIKWHIQRAPEWFPVAHEGSDVRVIKTEPWGIPPLRAFYVFDDAQVRLVWIEYL